VNGSARIGGNVGIRVFIQAGQFPASGNTSAALPSGCLAQNIISVFGVTLSSGSFPFDSVPWDYRGDVNWEVDYFISGSSTIQLILKGNNVFGKYWRCTIITS